MPTKVDDIGRRFITTTLTSNKGQGSSFYKKKEAEKQAPVISIPVDQYILEKGVDTLDSNWQGEKENETQDS